MIVGRGSGIISTLRSNAGILKKKKSFRDLRRAYVNEIEMSSDNLDTHSLEAFREKLAKQRKREFLINIVFLVLAIALITIILVFLSSSGWLS